jgi:1-acyl-sn-glycerol-3-phosphate acyltransferase
MYAIIGMITAVMFGFARLLYGMKIEGTENIPRKGPYILAFDEIGHMATMMTTIFLARHILSGRIERPVGFGDEFMWTQGWRRVYDKGDSTPIFPHGRGQGTHGLLKGLEALRQGKIVMMNPTGEMSWDGRPVPPKKAVAWLALRSGVPIVLVMATKGAYEVRPKWMERPQLIGSFSLRVGEPLYLTDAPLSQVSDEMVAQANARLRAEMNVLIYGSAQVA